MLKKLIIIVNIIIFNIIFIDFIYASSYEWDVGGLKQMDYDSIEYEEIEVELSFYCGVNNEMEGGPESSAGKLLVYGNLANNYYTGKESINGGKTPDDWKDLNNGYSLGTNIYIKDVGLFTIEDRGGSSDFNKQNRMDLFIPRKEGETDAEWEKRTNSYGRQKVKAKIIEDGTERIWAWPSGDSQSSSTNSGLKAGATSANKVGLNSKIVYDNIKKVSTAGSKPSLLTENCKDAVEVYWSKKTTIGDSDSVTSGATSPHVNIDYDSAEVPDEILSGDRTTKFNWLFDGNGGMAYNTTEAAILQYIVSIDVPRIDENGKETVKTLQVHKKVAGDIYRIFEEIKAGGFKIRTYDTGAYNWRGGQKIGSNGLYSMHCLGIAVDVNWDSNAYFVNGVLSCGIHWKPGVDEFSMPADGVAVTTFKKYGWKWGGDWNSVKDYMHFSLTGN